MYDKLNQFYLTRYNGYQFHTFKNKNKYFTDSLFKFINRKPVVIRLKWSDNLNKEICSQINKVDLFLIGEVDESKLIPSYPIIEKMGIGITPVLFIQMNGFVDGGGGNGSMNKVMNNFLWKCKELIGGYLSSEKKIFDVKRDNLDHGLTKNHRITKVIPIREYFCPNLHGWLSSDTAYNLKYALNKFKPKTVLELGSWLGKSAHYMKGIKPDIKMYCFDKFQNVCLTPYSYNKSTPIDHFYFNFLRYETFWANLNEFSNVYMISDNAFKAPMMFKSDEIDMIYIDFIKSEKKLMDFLEELFKKFPNTVIVGDDFVFDPVKIAFKKELTQYKKYVGILDESYIISPKPLDKDYYRVFKDKKVSGYVKVAKLIGSGKFPLAVRMVKKEKLKMNENREDLSLSNTLYHEFVMGAKNFLDGKNEIESILEMLYEYEKPMLVKNVLLLTYKDYLDHKINFM